MCHQNGFLGTLHAMLFMDDTVIVASSKKKHMEKMKILLHLCYDKGMEVNALKNRLPTGYAKKAGCKRHSKVIDI